MCAMHSKLASGPGPLNLASQELILSFAKLLQGLDSVNSESQPLISPSTDRLSLNCGTRVTCKWTWKLNVKYRTLQRRTFQKKDGVRTQNVSNESVVIWTSLLASPPLHSIGLFLIRRAHGRLAARAANLQRNTWKLMNFAYHKFARQFSSHCKQYFLLANFVEEMAFCPPIKLTGSVRVGIFIPLLNPSVNTTCVIESCYVTRRVVKTMGCFFPPKSNQQAE